MFFSEISLSFCTVYALQKLVVHVSLFTWESVSVNWRSWQGYQFAVCVRCSSHNYSGVRASQHCYCSIYLCTVWPAVAHDFTAGNRVTSSMSGYMPVFPSHLHEGLLYCSCISGNYFSSLYKNTWDLLVNRTCRTGVVSLCGSWQDSSMFALSQVSVFMWLMREI